MTAQDFILGVVCVSGVLGMALGLLIGALCQAGFGCETCHQKQQAAAARSFVEEQHP